jgi:hypothetical protein
MSANNFVLKHHHHQIEVEYTIGRTPGIPALVYNDGSDVKSFQTTEITRVETALGSLVSVSLQETKPPIVGGGSESFGFFLPDDIQVGPDQIKNFMTAGVYGTFPGPGTGPNSVPSWKCIELHGTARSVTVPLEQGATP